MLIRSCSQGDSPSGKRTAVIVTVIYQPDPGVSRAYQSHLYSTQFMPKLLLYKALGA